MKKTKQNQLSSNCCCICGMKNCRQSTDHTSFTLLSLTRLLSSSKKENSSLDLLKQKLQEFYEKLKTDIMQMIEKDQNLMQQHLNKFYYSHLNAQKININEICQLANGRYDRLPSKKIIKIVEELKKDKNAENLIQNSEIIQVNSSVLSFLQDFVQKKSTQKFKTYLPYCSLIQKSIPQLHIRRSLSEISNPEQIDEEAAKTYIWKNVSIKNKTKVLELSNKNITDFQLIRQMPVISSFKNIKDFQIRNNKITSLSCRLISSNMIHVKSIDLRGNAVGDQGIICIIKGIPHLRSFMISETKCTNLTAEAIVNGLVQIQVLWCEQNKIDDEHSIAIAKLPKLKVLSFAGNGLDGQTAQILKKIFNPKGYVIV